MLCLHFKHFPHQEQTKGKKIIGTWDLVYLVFGLQFVNAYIDGSIGNLKLF